MLYLRPGETFAGCRIESVCGSGGTGVVYLAEDALKRHVALKIVALCDARRELEGIRRYIRAAEGQPNLIRIFHAGIEQECLYYIMEAADRLENAGLAYVPKTLAAVLNRSGKLPPPAALGLVRALADGLRVLHAHGLIHRDIKPENIVFVGGVPKLCDPGLVCSTEATASFVGTLGFLPQECFDGRNLNTPGRDIYALGKVLYVAVTGELPAHYPRIPSDLSLSVRRKLWPLMIRVCNSNPRHRFQSAEEFCRAMPQELPMPSRFEQRMEDFRQWRLAHPAFWPAVAAVLLAVALTGGTGVHFYLKKQREFAAYLETCRRQCGEEAERFRKRDDLLTQIEVLAGRADAEKVRLALVQLPADPEKRLRIYREQSAFLRKLALRGCPTVPARADAAETARLSSQVRGLLASPLGQWLTAAEKTDLLRRLAPLETKAYATKLKPGKSMPYDQAFRMDFMYVPAGMYRAADGGIRTVGEAFWCADGELRGDIFDNRGGAHKAIVPGMPRTRLMWNELLSFCRRTTLARRFRGELPENYIVRPLTTTEWEWACRGAWAGTGDATAILKKDSGGRPREVRSGIPNNLGIYDMLGNVSELTVPDRADRLPHMADCCGASCRDSEARSTRKCDHPKYQFLDPFVGTRLAVARGDLSFFDREYFSTAARSGEFGGKHYELFTAVGGFVTRETAERMTRLLGGRPAVPDPPELLRFWERFYGETQTFPVIVDGKFADGCWRDHTGRPLTGKLPGAPKEAATPLAFQRGKLVCIEASVLPGVICQWTPEEYARRADPERIVRDPSVLHTWRDGRSRYVLISFPRAHTHTLRRMAELLGGRLAEPRTPELRERLKKALAGHADLLVVLGGEWRFGEWTFADGTKWQAQLESRYAFAPGFESCNPGLLNGTFYAVQRGQAFLLELPAE